MKLTQERLVELKTMAEHARSHFCIELAEAFVRSVPALIADLEEAQELIEPYRKDAERFQELLSRVGDDSGPTIVKIEDWSDEYPGYAWFAGLSQEQVIAELDAAIAAKGESE